MSLGMSLDSFERHVQPELRLIRRGKLRLVPVAELERWANENAEACSDVRAGPSIGRRMATGIRTRHARAASRATAAGAPAPELPGAGV